MNSRFGSNKMKAESSSDGDDCLLLNSSSDSESFRSLTNDDGSSYMEHLSNSADWQHGTSVTTSNACAMLLFLVQGLGHWGVCSLKALSHGFTHWLGTLRPPAVVLKGVEGSGRRDGSQPIHYLDGIRGIACFIVFNFHFLYPYTLTIFKGFGAPTSDGYHHYVHQLPYVSLLYRGRAMVMLFFALSGYVLSYRCLSQMRKQAWEDSQKSLSSLTLRRFTRLYVPPTISMSIVMVATFYGAFEPGRRFQSSDWRTGYQEHHPVQKATFSAQFQDFARMWWDWINLWNWNSYYSNYDPHTWTIPLELRSSMVLFILLVARTKLRFLYGFSLMLVSAVYCLMSVRWDVAIFLGGALVAELHIASPTKRPNLPSRSSGIITPSAPASHKRTPSTVGPRLGLLISLYMLAYPDEAGEKTPGYEVLASWTPSIYRDNRIFWNVVACVILMWCVGRDRLQSRFFETDIAQYLGKVSYAFYLTHGPLLHSIGFTIQPMIWELFGHESLYQWVFGLFIGWLIMLTLSLMVAHIFWRCVDMPLVTLTKRIEKAISVSS